MNQPGIEFDHAVNARFGFAYDFPRGWKVCESTNADGSTFTAPLNPSVEIRVYGSHAFEAETLDELVGLVMAAEERKVGFELLDQAPETCTVERLDGQEDQVPARRLTYRYQSDSTQIAVTIMLTQVSDLQFGVLCQAPINQFATYRPLFNSVMQRFKVLPHN